MSSDFDQIIGKWKWVKTKHIWHDISGSHVETVNSSDINEDDYYIEFVKKGLVFKYVNNKAIGKYKVKDSHGSKLSFANVWGYTIYLRDKSSIEINYYNGGDSIIVTGFFPRNKTDYGLSENSGDVIDNTFVRN